MTTDHSKLVERLRQLIADTEKWRMAHKARGALGQIEALGCSIRIKAFREVLAIALKDRTP